MNHFGKNLWLTLVAVTALILGTTPDADAIFIATLDDLGTVGIDIIVVDDVDGGVGTSTVKGISNAADGGAGDGIIFFNGPVGDFSVNVTTGISRPIVGSPNEAKIHLNSVNVSGGESTLQITLSDTDFLLNGQSGFPLSLQNDLGGTTNGTITAQGFVDFGNQAFGIGGSPIFSTAFQGPFGTGAFGDTVSALTSPIGATPFSLWEIVTITHGGPGKITSFDKELTAVSLQPTPEPATVLLHGTGLIGLIGYGWRRKQKHARQVREMV